MQPKSSNNNFKFNIDLSNVNQKKDHRSQSNKNQKKFKFINDDDEEEKSKEEQKEPPLANSFKFKQFKSIGNFNLGAAEPQQEMQDPASIQPRQQVSMSSQSFGVSDDQSNQLN